MNKLKKLEEYLLEIRQNALVTKGEKREFWLREVRKTLAKIEELKK